MQISDLQSLSRAMTVTQVISQYKAQFKVTIISALLTRRFICIRHTPSPDGSDVFVRMTAWRQFTDGSRSSLALVHLGYDAEDPLPLPWRSEENLIIGCYLCVTATRREQRESGSAPLHRDQSASTWLRLYFVLPPQPQTQHDVMYWYGLGFARCCARLLVLI